MATKQLNTDMFRIVGTKTIRVWFFLPQSLPKIENTVENVAFLRNQNDLKNIQKH